ncbi:guanine deaminase [Paucibacter sp. KCTC 42545]|uniref:guanine deaminase n=1 Tax=Paucibacter sp. KCTC 42545 TaxID=1768242 RepID=UPI000733A5B3|nr:guanine deaminase [Paucibacter sp. KCTC 42545]ALT75985.1 guanine deaminase [Paucibacter sp. KCTC 42545]
MPSETTIKSSSTPPNRLALRGDLLDFSAQPAWGVLDSPAVRFQPEHWLLIADGRIQGSQAAEPDESWHKVDHSGRLIMPGFVDTHVHCPQLDVIASYGTELLDWLNTYTFPAECRYADPAVAQAGAERFLDALLAHGTTAAVVFPTVHKVSAEALFAAAAERGMRLITGKVLMDRHAPPALLDDVASAERDCIDLIDRWHGQGPHGRLAYAVTPRFAPTSSAAQLAMAGALCRADASLYMQTHVAENRAEVRWVSDLFPQARSYLDVYDQLGLLHPRAVLAHGIWLDDEDRQALLRRGAQLAFCPSSNLFLGSGLFDWAAAAGTGVPVSVASDVGGGTSLSMQRNLLDAYKVQALAGQRLSAWAALHAATRGAAEGLGLTHELGHFGTNTLADVCVWDWACGPVAQARDAVAQNLHERVFAWMCLSDERNLVSSYVAGKISYHRKT